MFTIPPGVTAISFDIWKTLLNGNRAFSRPRLELIFKLLDQPIADIEAVVKAYRLADKFYNDEAERTGLDYGLGERLATIFGALGITATVPGRQALRNIQHEVGQLRLSPEYMPSFTESDLPRTLQVLQNHGFVLGLLSNTAIDNEQVLEQVLGNLGIWRFFQVKIFSCQDGRAKPHPGLFQRMARELKTEPHQVLHVGDNANADYRAVEAGLQAVLYAPKGSELPHITSVRELLGNE